MSFDLTVGWPPSSPAPGAIATDAGAAASSAAGAAGPSPAFLPATYVDPSSGVVVLQTRGPGDTVNTLPTIRQLDAYQSGATALPNARPAVDITEA
jgi:hypothetical protein